MLENAGKASYGARVPKAPPQDEILPLTPPAEVKKPTPAPDWVALTSAWTGLFAVLSAIVIPLLPGSRNPRAELERLAPYSLADWFLPAPLYLTVIALFLGIIVFWQSRREVRPFPDGLIAQRLQAAVGIVLAVLAVVIVYAFVALRGPA